MQCHKGPYCCVKPHHCVNNNCTEKHVNAVPVVTVNFLMSSDSIIQIVFGLDRDKVGEEGTGGGVPSPLFQPPCPHIPLPSTCCPPPPTFPWGPFANFSFFGG